jgi:hypothetical protein
MDCSGCFFHFAETNASGANPHLLASPIDEGANILQVGIPAPPPGVVGVADDVSKLRAFAAEFTLQCHNATLPTLKR